jgi:hypothetical protein
LGNIEAFALRDAFGDIEEDDITQFLEADQVGERAADISGTDESYFLTSHGTLPFRL